MSAFYILLNLFAIAFLLFLGAFFSATETAFTSISRISVRQMLKENAKNSIRVYKIKSELDQLISDCFNRNKFCKYPELLNCYGFCNKSFRGGICFVCHCRNYNFSYCFC